MWDRFRLKHWSTYVAFVIWGAGAFTSQPTIASFVVHFVVIPIFLISCIVMAHWEGRLSVSK